MPCANESVLIPMQNAGRWATRTDPITEEEIWIRASDATALAEGFIARAVAGDPAMLLGIPQPSWWTVAAHHLARIDAHVWALLTMPFRWLKRRTPAL